MNFLVIDVVIEIQNISDNPIKMELNIDIYL